jgi:hypothetical protein
MLMLGYMVVMNSVLLAETKSLEHACNSTLVTIYYCSQGLCSFDVLSYDVRI